MSSSTSSEGEGEGGTTAVAVAAGDVVVDAAPAEAHGLDLQHTTK